MPLFLVCCALFSCAFCCSHVYSVAEVAEAVLDMMDTLHVKRACLVAHSYGEQQGLCVSQRQTVAQAAPSDNWRCHITVLAASAA